MKLYFKKGKKRKNKNHSIYIQWFYSYALILALPVLLAIVFYFQSANSVKTEIIRANEAMLRQVQQMFDAKLGEVKNSAVQLGLNPRLLQALVEVPNTPEARQTYYDLMKDLKIVVSSVSSIRHFYLFLNNYDKIITPLEQTDRETLYSGLHATDEMSFEQWVEIINQSRSAGFRTLYINDRGVNQCVFTYFQQLPIYATQRPLGVLVFILDSYEIESLISNTEWVNRGGVYVLDSTGEILLSNNGNIEGLNLQYDELTDDNSVLQMEFNGKKYTVSYVKSDYTDWKYVSVMPYNTYFSQANYIKIVFISLAFMVVIGGLLLAVYMTRRNYKPVKSIMQSIVFPEDAQGEKWSNEFNTIKQYISSFKTQRYLFRDSFILKLLTSDEKTGEEMERAKTEYGISFVTDIFAVMLVRIDQSNLYSAENEKSSSDLAEMLVKRMVDALEERFGVFTVQRQGIITAILNLKSEMPFDEAMSIIDAVVAEIRKVFNESTGVLFTVSVSDFHRGILTLPHANNEAAKAMEYRLSLGKNQTILYNKIKEIPQSSYIYSLENEQSLINSILEGNTAEATAMVQYLFKNIRSQHLFDLRIIKCFMHDLASTMLKVFGYANDEELSKEVNPMNRIIACETIDELYNTVIGIVTQTSEYFKERAAEEKLSDKVLEHIKAHYADATINVNAIGDYFGMSPSYLSKIFRKETGERLLDCIARTRIDAAKNLLKETNHTIKEIAENTGFIDSNAFILVFKKREGITPGQYRAKHR